MIRNKDIKEKVEGITLIALVITVVILIILATVSLNVVLGEGGLVDRAQQAKNLTEQAALEEQKALNSLLSEYDDILAEDKEYNISIQSNIVTYNESLGEFPIIYSITGTKDGEKVYENMLMVNVTKSGVNDNNTNVRGIPTGTALTITPIYYSPNYDLLSENTQTIEFNETESKTVEFKYEYNGKIIGNSGIA
jgi:type II secretory pathway pseudopilin PulG